jgi:hypothetical protein
MSDNSDKPWNWFAVGTNYNLLKFSIHEKSIMLIKQWHMANVIKKQWFRCITDPAFAMCRNRLLREFESKDSIFH